MDYYQLALGVGVVVVLLLIINGLTFLLWKLFKMLKYPIIYNIFRKKMKDEDIEWCANAINNGWNETTCKMKLLLYGNSKNRINEIMYIYKQVNKRLKEKMKGGSITQ